MNNFPFCSNCEKLKSQLQTYYTLPFTTKAQQYLFELIHKHQTFVTAQRVYTSQETREREFLDRISQELIGGLLGETEYSQLKGATA